MLKLRLSLTQESCIDSASKAAELVCLVSAGTVNGIGCQFTRKRLFQINDLMHIICSKKPSCILSPVFYLNDAVIGVIVLGSKQLVGLLQGKGDKSYK